MKDIIVNILVFAIPWSGTYALDVMISGVPDFNVLPEVKSFYEDGSFYPAMANILAYHSEHWDWPPDVYGLSPPLWDWEPDDYPPAYGTWGDGDYYPDGYEDEEYGYQFQRWMFGCRESKEDVKISSEVGGDIMKISRVFESFLNDIDTHGYCFWELTALDPSSAGISWDQYREEIDNHRPVLLKLNLSGFEDEYFTGVGYRVVPGHKYALVYTSFNGAAPPEPVPVQVDGQGLYGMLVEPRGYPDGLIYPYNYPFTGDLDPGEEKISFSIGNECGGKTMQYYRVYRGKHPTGPFSAGMGQVMLTCHHPWLQKTIWDDNFWDRPGDYNEDYYYLIIDETYRQWWPNTTDDGPPFAVDWLEDPPADYRPGPPTEVTVADIPGDDGGSVKIEWTLSASDNVEEYHIYRNADILMTGKTAFQEVGEVGDYRLIAVVGGAATEFIDVGVPRNDLDVYYSVRAYGAAYASEDGESLGADPASGRALDNRPFRPRDLTAVVSGSDVVISFAAAFKEEETGFAVDHYEVWRQDTSYVSHSSAPEKLADIDADGGPAYEFTDTTASAGVTYRYWAVSVKAGGALRSGESFPAYVEK